jgi:hypothetical protein
MRTARLQTNDLGHTEQFFNTLLSKNEIKEAEKSILSEQSKSAQNGGSMSFKMDGKPRFSDPPAPPPQQPLPEKPDVTRMYSFDPSTPSLKRSTTERPRSVPNVPQERPEPTSQIISLVEALASAKKDCDDMKTLVHVLEDKLKEERELREAAEGLAKRLELESSSSKMNGFAKGGLDGSVIEEAFEPPLENVSQTLETSSNQSASPKVAGDAVEASTKLQEKLELMMVEMKEMKERMESYRRRAETAEEERDHDRKTLAEMVEKIRSDEQARRSGSTERARSPIKDAHAMTGTTSNDSLDGNVDLLPLLHKGDTRNDKALGPLSDLAMSDQHLAMALARPQGSHDRLLYHSAPYASMLGVVLLGMGLMAYMNGWQKVER